MSIREYIKQYLKYNYPRKTIRQIIEELGENHSHYIRQCLREAGQEFEFITYHKLTNTSQETIDGLVSIASKYRGRWIGDMAKVKLEEIFNSNRTALIPQMLYEEYSVPQIAEKLNVNESLVWQVKSSLPPSSAS